MQLQLHLFWRLAFPDLHLDIWRNCWTGMWSWCIHQWVDLRSFHKISRYYCRFDQTQSASYKYTYWVPLCLLTKHGWWLYCRYLPISPLVHWQVEQGHICTIPTESKVSFAHCTYHLVVKGNMNVNHKAVNLHLFQCKNYQVCINVINFMIVSFSPINQL